MNKNALIVFVKSGSNVKTRIAKETNVETALAIYEELVNSCANLCNALFEIDLLLYYSPKITSNDVWESIAFKKLTQVEGDLGTKMKCAFKETLEKYEKAVIIGSDCPYLTRDHIYMAFESLNKADVVIGPAVDGGYYLLGMNSFIEKLFEGIQWSTSTVYYETIDILFSERKSVQVLERLIDVDQYGDYLRWKKGL